mgnify:CR=1 FL=1
MWGEWKEPSTDGTTERSGWVLGSFCLSRLPPCRLVPRLSFIPAAGLGEGSKWKTRDDKTSGWVNDPRPRPFRPFVVRSLTPSFVPHVGRSVPHFLRNDGTEEWRDGVKVERNRGRPFARYASLSLGRFVPPSHPRRRRVALTSLAPVSDGNGNNMRE